MLRCRQLFNNIQRYNHHHNSPSKNSVKTDNGVTESKINYIVARVNTIDILLKFNYGFTLIFGWFSVFK